MAVFVVRRLIVSFFILIASTMFVYWLVAVSDDPLRDLRADQSPNRDQKIAERRERLHLDQPIPQRYVGWAKGVASCAVPAKRCDFGLNRQGQEVQPLLTQAMTVTLRLVVAATALAILIGVTAGIVSALRQYSGFDYTITFAAFLFFSLPLFWVAVLLKQYIAIRFNDWLRDPTFAPATVVVLSVLSGLMWRAVIGGDRRRKWTVFGAAAAATAGVLVYLSAVEWFKYPGLGPGLIAVLALASAFAMTALISGLKRRAVLYSCLATAAVGVISSLALGSVLDDPSWSTVLLLLAVALVVSGAIGAALGGLDRSQAVRASMLTGVLTGAFIFVDRMFQAVPAYSTRVNGRIIATVGSNTPNFTGTFWERMLDDATHLVLPTLAIMLISLATYSRFTRATMLEVMNQDYVRTARSKGLTERTVVMRHAFRNALIPVTTLAAIDFGAVIGGAIITENVFAWKGMGTLFVRGLYDTDPNPVMAFFVVAALSVVVFNMLADIAYAYLDPRIRLS